MSCSSPRLFQHAQWQRLPLRGVPIISVISTINVSAVLYCDVPGTELEPASDRWTLDGQTDLFDSVHLQFGYFGLAMGATTTTTGRIKVGGRSRKSEAITPPWTHPSPTRSLAAERLLSFIS
jgi:hypothetical protein